MSKVLIARNLPDAVVAEAEELFDITYRNSPLPMSTAEMVEALQTYDAILPTLGDLFSADVFAQAGDTKCRILANFGVGFNHIDTGAAAALGITVTNTPGAVTDATADVAMTLMLMSARRAGEGERMLRAGNWQGWHPVQMLGMHLSGKTVGIVGMGRIGQAIAHRCHFGFGMDVCYVARSAKDLPHPADRYGDALAMAPHVDVLLAAVPGGAETYHLMDAEVFGAMKPTAHFINISRGEVVDEAALVAALQRGEIAGAGLDVYEFEPSVPAELIAMENVTLLPHLGTAALEVREGMGRMALENLKAFFDGKPVPNAV